MDEIGEGAKKKVPINHQHTRLQKEADDESWISGEELKTDGSSDEEHSTKIKHNKRQKRPIRARQRSCDIDVLSEKKVEETLKLKEEDRRGSSHSITESLNLEHNWRPKRGSLKLPNLTDGLYDEMDEDISIMEENGVGDGWVNERGKKIDEVQKSIAALEKAIVEKTHLFETEKCERLKTQEELCSKISKSNDNNTGLFMELCRFEKNSSPTDDDIEEEVNESQKLIKIKKRNHRNKDFIQRNIELAAKMTRLSLTDEEKEKLDHLLENIDSFEYGEGNVISDDETAVDEFDDCDDASLNAFFISRKEKQKINEIDNRLMELHDSELVTTDESQIFSRDFPLEESSGEPSEVDQ